VRKNSRYRRDCLCRDRYYYLGYLSFAHFCITGN